MSETIALTEFGFSATRFDCSGKTVRFGGPDGFYEAELLRGALDGLAGLAFSLLGHPSGLLGRVRRCTWAVAAPRWSPYPPGTAVKKTENGFRNTDDNCRVLIIEGPEVVVLRFNRKIPRGLIFALKTLFTGREYPRDIPGGLPPSKKENGYGLGQEGGE